MGVATPTGVEGSSWEKKEICHPKVAIIYLLSWIRRRLTCYYQSCYPNPQWDKLKIMVVNIWNMFSDELMVANKHQCIQLIYRTNLRMEMTYTRKWYKGIIQLGQQKWVHALNLLLIERIPRGYISLNKNCVCSYW